MIERVRVVGGGRQGIALSAEACAYVAATIVRDLDLLDHFPEVPGELPPFFGEEPIDSLVLEGVDFIELVERLVELKEDTDTYFLCLATLHKARLKYERILRTQAVPTIDQVGPRALLEFGKLSPRLLAAFLFWRKWIYDIDNRAAQETGYLFEPIIANAIGGAPVSAKRSPVRRRSAPSKGRQVDCIKEGRAYELKLRVTIAASGQGRWREELEFPKDCRESGYVPVLVVLDATMNPKLTELREVFESAGGEVYVGEDAWHHLDSLAGDTMSRFLERYVHGPIEELLKDSRRPLPDFRLEMREHEIVVWSGEESFSIPRNEEGAGNGEEEPLPEDIDEEISGP